MKTIVQTLSCLVGALCITLEAGAQDLNETVLKNGLNYLNTPYVAHALDTDGPEELILNCDELDCQTFVEYVLAESLCPKLENGDISESAFADKVQQIRYRNGKIDGYASRLHYVTDWINNAVSAGILEDVTAEKSPSTLTVSVSYMTTHPEQYKQLAGSPENVTRMKEVEQSLNGQQVHYLPKDQLPYNGTAWIKNGDIIAITTSTPGLDIAHMGIAFYVEGKLTLLHASQKEGKVCVSTTTLVQMLKDHKDWTGIRVLRLKR